MRQVALPLEGDYWSQHGRWQCGAAGYRELWRRGVILLTLLSLTRFFEELSNLHGFYFSV